MREIGLLLVDVIHLEQRGGAFARGRRKNRRIGQRVALAVHEIARRANCLRPNPQDRCLSRCADPQMPLVQQKIHAMIFQLNRIRIRVRHALHHFDCAHVYFVPAWRPRLGLYLPGHFHARLLRQSFQRPECLRILLERHHALHHAGAVAKNREKKLARLAQVVKPPANLHYLARVLSGLLDGYDCGNFSAHRLCGLRPSFSEVFLDLVKRFLDLIE